MYEYKATVVRVIDADTVDLAVDLGFRMGHVDRFRLYGIDAAERGQEGWSEAKAALEGKLPVGTALTIETYHPKDRDARDSFGRWLATLFIATDGEDINDWLIKQGHAKPYLR